MRDLPAPCASQNRDSRRQQLEQAHLRAGCAGSAPQVGRKLRGLLSRWVSLGLNDLRSPPTLSNDSRDIRKRATIRTIAYGAARHRYAPKKSANTPVY